MAEYKGIKPIKCLPQCKPGYKGKNMRGGRKAVFAQSPAYKIEHDTAIPWNWLRYTNQPRYQATEPFTLY